MLATRKVSSNDKLDQSVTKELCKEKITALLKSKKNSNLTDLAPILCKWALKAVEYSCGQRKDILPIEKTDKSFLGSLRLGSLLQQSLETKSEIMKEQFDSFIEILVPELELSNDMSVYDTKILPSQLERLKRHELNSIKMRLDSLEKSKQEQNNSKGFSKQSKQSHSFDLSKLEQARAPSDHFVDLAPSFKGQLESARLDLANITEHQSVFSSIDLKSMRAPEQTPYHSAYSPDLAEKFDRVNDLVN